MCVTLYGYFLRKIIDGGRDSGGIVTLADLPAKRSQQEERRQESEGMRERREMIYSKRERLELCIEDSVEERKSRRTRMKNRSYTIVSSST